MESGSRVNEQGATGLGPYKATKLWNDVISAFRQGIPKGRHRRYMRTADNCFLGSTAVDWLLEYLKKQRDFGADVTRQQTTQLLNKFYKAGIFEEIQVSRRGRNKSDFSDSNRLYRFLPLSPSKGTRTPLAVRNSNNIPQPVDPKPVKPEKPVRRDTVLRQEKKSVGQGKENVQKTGAAGNLDVSSLPRCHLVGRFLTGSEISEVWKTAVLSRLKKVLGVGSLENILQDCVVNGSHIRHNCIFLNKSGIVTNIQPNDQLPHWVLSAMKCLARWPEKVEGDLPSYPGFEKDVFRVVKDYFLDLSEPLVTYELYDVIINAFVQACNQLPRHSSPFSHAGNDQPSFRHSLWSDSSLENVIMNLTRKYCMADSKSDLFSLADSRPDLFTSTEGFREFYSRSNLCSTAYSRSNVATSMNDLASSQQSVADPDKGCLHRMVRSQGDLLQKRKHHTNSNTLPCGHSKSAADLFGQHEQGGSNSCKDLRGIGNSLRNLHGGRSAINLHATSNSQNLTVSSRANSHSALGHLSGFSGFKDSKRFCSNPDLEVSRFETAFGPENQTVTRVYYSNGMATDFHHKSAQEQEELSPVETHFDVIIDKCGSHSQSFHISFPCSNKSSNLTGGSETSRSAMSRSCSCGFQQQTSGVYDSSQGLSSLQLSRAPSQNEPLPTMHAHERKPPLYRRRRTERCNTFAGSQFTMDIQRASRGLDEWDREMSASTPYLPGCAVGVDSYRTNTLDKKPPHSGARSAASSASQRSSTLYLNLPQSGLHVERATKALQVVCLLIPPPSRRKLHFLLKLMSKLAANPFLTLDPNQSTRSLVLGTFQHAILRSPDESDLDAVLVFQLVSFLVDHHMDIMTVPLNLKEAVEDRLKSLEKPQIVYSPRDPSSLRFTRPMSKEQYEASRVNHSHHALLDLLDGIVGHQKMPDHQKKQRLKQFQKTYPQIYKQRFPDDRSDPLKAEQRLRTKPPVFVRPLMKLRGLRV